MSPLFVYWGLNVYCVCKQKNMLNKCGMHYALHIGRD